jgi:hypothetical protein
MSTTKEANMESFNEDEEVNPIEKLRRANPT